MMGSLFSTISPIDVKPGREGQPALSTVACADAGSSFLKHGYLNAYITMPCPLKVPFSQLFQPFIEERNSNRSNVPVYWPQVTDCVPEGIDRMMTAAVGPAQLPDVFVTSGYNILFNPSFRERFLKSRLMGGIPACFYPEGYPQNLLLAAERFQIGFLGFSSWGVVHNKTADGNYPVPEKWTDLVAPEYKGAFSIHGCHGHAGSLTMLLYLQKKTGDNAVGLLGSNIAKVRHFAEMIDEMGTKRSGVTPFYLMPYSAISNIPSTKQVDVLPLDGGLLTPMVMLVKQSKLEASKGLIEFFTSQVFKNTLAKNAYFQPNELWGIERYDFADMELLSEIGFPEANLLNEKFCVALGDKIRK